MQFTVEAYQTVSGDTPYYVALEEFKKVSQKLYDKVLLWVTYLGDDQFHLNDATKAIGGGLYELRVRQGSHFARVFFIKTSGRVILLLSGYYKSSNKIPQEHLDRARALQQEANARRGQ